MISKPIPIRDLLEIIGGELFADLLIAGSLLAVGFSAWQLIQEPRDFLWWIVLIVAALSLAWSVRTRSRFPSFKREFELTAQRERVETYGNKVGLIQANLAQAAAVISELEQELDSKSKLLARVKEEQEHFERLLSLEKEQVQSLVYLLSSEMERKSQHEFRRNALWDIGVAIASLFFGFIIGRLIGQ